MDLAPTKDGLPKLRILFLGFSLASLAVCAFGAAAHYLKWAWRTRGSRLVAASMFFLLCAFLPDPRDLATGFKSLIKPKTAFFLFWILFFVVSHSGISGPRRGTETHFLTESGNDLGYLKVTLSVIHIRRPGFMALFRERPCFITMCGVFLSYWL